MKMKNEGRSRYSVHRLSDYGGNGGLRGFPAQDAFWKMHYEIDRLFNNRKIAYFN